MKVPASKRAERQGVLGLKHRKIFKIFFFRITWPRCLYFVTGNCLAVLYQVYSNEGLIFRNGPDLEGLLFQS